MGTFQTLNALFYKVTVCFIFLFFIFSSSSSFPKHFFSFKLLLSMLVDDLQQLLLPSTILTG